MLKLDRGARRRLGVPTFAAAAILTFLLLVAFEGDESAPSELSDVPVEPAGPAAPRPPRSRQEEPRGPRGPASSPGPVEMLGQRLVVGFQGTEPSAQLITRIRRGRIGGVILFDRNIQSLEQVRRLIATLQDEAEQAGQPPLLVAVDQEGGSVRRFREGPPPQAAREMGRQKLDLTRGDGIETGEFLRDLGVNVDLAPVADVARSKNAFIEREGRSFGMDPVQAVEHASAFAAGLRLRDVAATAKHFPGLGSATQNTDQQAQTLTFNEADVRPFELLIDDGIPLVMLSMATYKGGPSDGKPAAMSPALNGYLRDRLAFDGVTITDALDSPAAQTLGPDRSVQAAQAGVDILLFSGDGREQYQSLRRAVQAGKIDLGNLELAYLRIVGLKHSLEGQGR